MLFYLVFVAQVFLIYLTSRKVTRGFYMILRSLVSEDKTLSLFSLIFLPGTFLHEASHYLSAKLLLVPVGDFSVKPVRHKQDIKMGSVSIGRTDPIRRFLIGVAPLVLGMIIVTLLSYLISMVDAAWIKILLTFLIFSIANSMFSSKKDLEGAVKLFTTMIIFIIIFRFMGVSVKLPVSAADAIELNSLSQTAVKWFSLPVLINLFIAFLVT